MENNIETNLLSLLIPTTGSKSHFFAELNFSPTAQSHVEVKVRLKGAGIFYTNYSYTTVFVRNAAYGT
jgi:hypothetical protein